MGSVGQGVIVPEPAVAASAAAQSKMSNMSENFRFFLYWP
jgi:hypothetical protein